MLEYIIVKEPVDGGNQYEKHIHLADQEHDYLFQDSLHGYQERVYSRSYFVG